MSEHGNKGYFFTFWGCWFGAVSVLIGVYSVYRIHYPPTLKIDADGSKMDRTWKRNLEPSPNDPSNGEVESKIGSKPKIMMLLKEHQDFLKLVGFFTLWFLLSAVYWQYVYPKLGPIRPKRIQSSKK